MEPVFAKLIVAVAIGFAGFLDVASAQTANICKATLGESDAKTSEVSTEQVRAIVSEGGVILIDTRTSCGIRRRPSTRARLLDGPPTDHWRSSSVLSSRIKRGLSAVLQRVRFVRRAGVLAISSPWRLYECAAGINLEFRSGGRSEAKWKSNSMG